MSTLYTGLSELVSLAKGGTTPTLQPATSDIIIGQVLDVITDSNEPEKIGTVRFRNIATQYNKEENAIQLYARPLDRSNYRLPLPGEQIVCVRAFGPRIAGGYVALTYYISVVTSETQIINNIIPFLGSNPAHLQSKSGPQVSVDILSKRFEKKIKHNTKALEGKRSIEKLREGDKILEGRYGGSIKFSSTIAADNTQTFKKGGSLDGDPLVIIKANRKEQTPTLVHVDDKPNEDDVSIYMTTSQTVSIKLACSKDMLSWNLDAATGVLTKPQDPSQIYQKMIDTTIPVDQAYLTPTGSK